MALAAPADTQQVLVLIEVKLQCTLISMVQSFTDSARQMDVGGSHHRALLCFLDGHDSLQRVSRLFFRLMILYQLQDFLFVLVEKISG